MPVTRAELYRNYKPRRVQTTATNAWAPDIARRISGQIALETYVSAPHPYRHTEFRLRRPFMPQPVIPVGEEGAAELNTAQTSIMRALKDSGLEPPPGMNATEIRRWLSNALRAMGPFVVEIQRQPFTPTMEEWLKLPAQTQKIAIARWLGLTVTTSYVPPIPYNGPAAAAAVAAAAAPVGQPASPLATAPPPAVPPQTPVGQPTNPLATSFPPTVSLYPMANAPPPQAGAGAGATPVSLMRPSQRSIFTSPASVIGGSSYGDQGESIEATTPFERYLRESSASDTGPTLKDLRALSTGSTPEVLRRNEAIKNAAAAGLFGVSGLTPVQKKPYPKKKKVVQSRPADEITTVNLAKETRRGQWSSYG